MPKSVLGVTHAVEVLVTHLYKAFDLVVSLYIFKSDFFIHTVNLPIVVRFYDLIERIVRKISVIFVHCTAEFFDRVAYLHK